MIEKIIFLLLLFTFLCILIYYLLKEKDLDKDGFIKFSLVLIGFLIAFYIRIIIYGGSIIASPDESNYLDILYRLDAGSTATLSGAGYVLFMQFLHKITGLEFTTLVSLFAFLITTISFFLIYSIFKYELKNKRDAAISTVLLMTTTYFLWPVFEGRPQQLGMILFLAAGLLFYRYLNDKKYAVAFAFAYLLTFFYHILSFFILSGSIFLICYWKFLKKEKIINRFIFFVILFGTCMVLFFCPNFIYSSMNGAVIYMIAQFTYPLCLIRDYKISGLLIALAVIGFAFITYFIRRFNFTRLSKEFLQKKLSKILMVLAIIAVLIMQYTLIKQFHEPIYHNSIAIFLLFELSNIFFGILFLAGFWNALKEENENGCVFLNYALSLMVLGASITLVSIFFPAGFNNALIRIINYWTIFAAPVALIGLKRINYKKILALMLAVFIILSLVSVSRDPSIFNSEKYWDNKDIFALKWACKNPGLFFINNTQNDYGVSSKESTYKTLFDIVQAKKEFNCSGIIITKIALIKNYTLEKVYAKENIEIYEIKSDNQTAIQFLEKSYLESMKQDLTPYKELNNDSRCP